MLSTTFEANGDVVMTGSGEPESPLPQAERIIDMAIAEIILYMLEL
ncbi:MAG: hypothetical protein ACK5MF_00475 [Vibrio sp.]